MDYYYLQQERHSTTLFRTGEPKEGLQLVPPELVPQVKIAVDAIIPFRIIDGSIEVAQVARPDWESYWDWDLSQWIDPRTQEQIASALQAEIVKATQNCLDTFAQTRNYDGILSACTYATSSVPAFAAEGQYCVASRDGTWAALYVILGEVQAGTRAVPTGFADIEGDLPVLGWPA